MTTSEMIAQVGVNAARRAVLYTEYTAAIAGLLPIVSELRDLSFETANLHKTLQSTDPAAEASARALEPGLVGPYGRPVIELWNPHDGLRLVASDGVHLWPPRL